MKKFTFVFFISGLISHLAAAATFTSSEIDMVFAGYPGGGIAFLPVDGTINPANCPKTQVYVMPPEYDTQSALSILLAAKMTGKKVFFSVRHDICAELPQTDNPGAFPVIQRVAIK